MNKRHFLLLAMSALLVPVAACADKSSSAGTDNEALNEFHSGILENFSGVTHVTPSELNTDDKSIILFDVREADEFAVSHIKGAVRVDPSLKAEAFISQFKQDWTGKKVVFYCSVGQRSSMMAAETQATLKEQGAAQVVNLEKGIFGWHNQSLPLTNENGQTDRVHPYNAYWGRLVNRKDMTAYEP